MCAHNRLVFLKHLNVEASNLLDNQCSIIKHLGILVTNLLKSPQYVYRGTKDGGWLHLFLGTTFVLQSTLNSIISVGYKNSLEHT